VDDFLLADQNLFGRQLYWMGQDKAVVLVTYASADKQTARRRAGADGAQGRLCRQGRRDDGGRQPARRRRDPVIADAKAAASICRSSSTTSSWSAKNWA